MKLNGITGKGSGKLGSSVFATVAGEQVVRQYNGNVSNPNTEAQVGQRAKFKLASQLAAAMSGEIAIPKKGMVSARNQFVKKNIGQITIENDIASVDYVNIQLTDGATNLLGVTGSINGSVIQCELDGDNTNLIDRCVYVLYKITENDQLVFAGSKVVEEAGNNGKFATTMTADDVNYVLYAYGIKDKSDAAAAKYGSYSISTATQVAKLVANRSISTSDFVFTKTVGFNVESME